MNENKPTNEHQLLLFRFGVDQKGISFSYAIYPFTTLCLAPLTDNNLINPGRVKFILSFSEFLALPPEFLSSSSLRSPPVLC
ncbi:MAG: hypothetical protein ACLQQ4_12915 [Bacteroidia bacterium]